MIKVLKGNDWAKIKRIIDKAVEIEKNRIAGQPLTDREYHTAQGYIQGLKSVEIRLKKAARKELKQNNED